MEELRKSLNESLFHRVSSPMYGTFIMSWVITNRKIFYITFFVDWDILVELWKGNKLDYILSFYPWWISNWLDFLCGFWSICKLVLIPILAVYIYLWRFSRLDKIVYDKYQDNEQEKWIKKNNILNYRSKAKKQLLEGEKEVIQLEKEVISQKGENLDSQLDMWQKSFESLHWDRLYQLLINVSNVVYEFSGYLYDGDGKRINSTDLWFLDTNELIIIDSDGVRISLTEKWKYFLKQYL